MNVRNFTFEKDTFSEKAQGFDKNYHQVFLLIKLLQTKPQVKNMNNNFYCLHYTKIKKRDEKEIVNKKMNINFLMIS